MGGEGGEGVEGVEGVEGGAGASLALGRPWFASASGKWGVAPGAGVGDCDFQDVQAMPEE